MFLWFTAVMLRSRLDGRSVWKSSRIWQKNSKTFEQLNELEINLEASQKLIKQLLP